MVDIYIKADTIEQVLLDFPFISREGVFLSDSAFHSAYIVGNEVATPATFDAEGNLLTEATYTGKILVNIRARSGSYAVGVMANGSEVINPSTPDCVWG